MKRVPVMLVPAAKDYIWGGSRLNDDFQLGLDADPLAEAWACSTHPDGPSRLITGEDLRELLARDPEMLGTRVLRITEGRPELPILIKLIDAKQNLSVQVHPDDTYAAEHEGQWGKTEMWYVLDAGPSATLVYGFNRNVTEAEIRRGIERGTVVNLLNHVPVKKNDVFYIEAGTVHALGAGCLIAEIQQSSNLTYRLYDYDRVGKDGCKRELHIDKALEVVKREGSNTPRQPMRVLKYSSGCATELLTRCKYFQVERMLLNTEVKRELVDYKTGENSFHALLVVDGCGSITAEEHLMNFFMGDCIFIPANSVPLKLHGMATLLDVSC